ncbi:MAG: ribonuclease III [Planctomycetia bacterium]
MSTSSSNNAGDSSETPEPAPTSVGDGRSSSDGLSPDDSPLDVGEGLPLMVVADRLEPPVRRFGAGVLDDDDEDEDLQDDDFVENRLVDANDDDHCGADVERSSGQRLDVSAADGLADCQRRLGYTFRQPKLLLNALTHASSSDSRLASNERLEFLGDSVLGLVVCEQLYRVFPDLLEGELTKIKSVVVSRRTCARITRRLELDRFLVLGKGMSSQSAIPQSVLADAFESLIAAVFLDGGWEPAKALVLAHLRDEITKVAGGGTEENHKSHLQQRAQRELSITPTYELLSEAGPDHSKNFQVAAVIGSKRFPPAWGRSKKEAEQRAAARALEVLDTDDVSGVTLPERG